MCAKACQKLLKTITFIKKYIFNVKMPKKTSKDNGLETDENVAEYGPSESGKTDSAKQKASRTLKSSKSAKQAGDTELIVTEKPKAAFMVAQALADDGVDKESINTVPVYSVTHNGKRILVTSAVGHLFTLSEDDSNGRKHIPVFDVVWKPVYEINKTVKYSQNYVKTLKELGKTNPKKIIIATDYDIEGEVIGLNVVRFALGQKDASRMKFSTLTRNDLIDSYDHASPHLDWGQAKAGETRHKLDWFYGINMSRLLTNLLSGSYDHKQMSIGRVQGPALKVLVEKELEISKFKSEPFWEIVISARKASSKDVKDRFDAKHKDDQIFDKIKADAIFQKIEHEKSGKVVDAKKSKTNQLPPYPFDLTTLQTEAFRTLKIKPKDTLSMAQELYIGGFISYPRTSSQQLPPSIGYKKILDSLARNPMYKELCNMLLKKGSLKPNNGKKDDPAHPAIYPTGIVPASITGRTLKLYDLIVKRFLATFGDNAVRETAVVEIDVKNEIFVARGVITLEKGWHELYEPYTALKEEPLPMLDKGDDIDVLKCDKNEKETQPPKRYTESSIIKELEKRNLGTKSTRANIIETLYNRKYIEGSPIKATELGIKTIELLEKFSPLIVDEALTRQFEENLEFIREGKKEPEKILDDAKDTITHIISDFNKHKKEASTELVEANKIATKEANTISSCPICKEGKAVMKKGKYGLFIACSRYPDCTYIFNIPFGAKNPKQTEKLCEACSNNLVRFTVRNRSEELCINPNCPINIKKKEEKAQKKPAEKTGRMCPKCKHELVIRDSRFGKFIACSGFPKCRYTEKILSDDKSGSPTSSDKKAGAREPSKPITKN